MADDELDDWLDGNEIDNPILRYRIGGGEQDEIVVLLLELNGEPGEDGPRRAVVEFYNPHAFAGFLETLEEAAASYLFALNHGFDAYAKENNDSNDDATD